mmetsp:Transcript_31095/g.75154  ORF Transcript_31095/g.75154 Transcript_31095/m.75154 type:complete len:582 (+) Transcript_31095:185-1930(+)
MWMTATATALTSTFAAIVLIWLAIEVVFVVVFYRIWLPRFQQLRPPEDYRGYSRDRRKLLCRILSRVEKTCMEHNIPLRETLRQYVREWFQPISNTTATTTTTTTTTSTSSDIDGADDTTDNNNNDHDKQSENNKDDGDDGCPTKEEDLWWPKRDDMDHFFAWAFFGRKYEELDDWMHKDMERMYETIETHYGLVFEPGTSPNYKPMRLSLDPLQPSYRPFVIYAFFSSMKLLAGLALRATGFYACKSSTGLMYFYRPARRLPYRRRTFFKNNQADNQNVDDHNSNNDHIGIAKKIPLIFLHGIAPGGLFFYIPMLFYLGGDGRPLLFFENPDISFYILGGCPPNERETIISVWEAVDKHLGTTQEVGLIGHSFGSCPITWLLHSAEKTRIRQIVLVDPVSILLSEPDVVQNFLYQRNCLRKKKMPIKIGVVSNEIFTEHYLRRHFSWYNSELWLEDLPDHAKVLVCLSGEDSIVPSQKVHREVLRKPDVEILVWENAGHAHCVTRPRTWRQIQMLMRRQEQMIFQETTTTTIDMSTSNSTFPSSSSSSIQQDISTTQTIPTDVEHTTGNTMTTISEKKDL